MSDQVKPIGDEKPATEAKTPEVVSIPPSPAKTPEVVAPAKAS